MKTVVANEYFVQPWTSENMGGREGALALGVGSYSPQFFIPDWQTARQLAFAMLEMTDAYAFAEDKENDDAGR